MVGSSGLFVHNGNFHFRPEYSSCKSSLVFFVQEDRSCTHRAGTKTGIGVACVRISCCLGVPTPRCECMSLADSFSDLQTCKYAAKVPTAAAGSITHCCDLLGVENPLIPRWSADKCTRSPALSMCED